ncbi:MAG: hypothetical protein AB7L09_02450 [Nitrospira sp.]
MNPIDDPPIRELAGRAARLVRDAPLGPPVANSWLREVEVAGYRIVFEEPVDINRPSRLDICIGTSIIYSETYSIPRGTRELHRALTTLRQNMALEDLSDVREG